MHPHPELPISRWTKTTLSSNDIVLSDMVMIPPHTSMREATLEERTKRALALARQLGLNQLQGPKRARLPVGFIASGISYCYLEEVLKMIGLWDRTPVLKLGMTYPIDAEDILDLAGRVEHLVVVEEKRGFLESQVSELLISLRQHGKLTPSIVLRALCIPPPKADLRREGLIGSLRL